MKVTITNILSCPRCGHEENHPTFRDAVLIRGHKVYRNGWWSQCLVCSGYYDPVTLRVTEHNHNPKTGWFQS